MGIESLDDVGRDGRSRHSTIAGKFRAIPFNSDHDRQSNGVMLKLLIQGKERPVHGIIGAFLAQYCLNTAHERFVGIVTSDVQVSPDILLEVIKTGLDPHCREVLPGGKLQVDIVVTDHQFRTRGDDPEVKEEFTPGLISFLRNHQDNGDIMPEVVNAPEQHPIVVLSRNVEIFSIKDKGVRESGTIRVGKLIVVG